MSSLAVTLALKPWPWPSVGARARTRPGLFRSPAAGAGRVSHPYPLPNGRKRTTGAALLVPQVNVRRDYMRCG